VENISESKINLSFARGMAQRQKYVTRFLFQLANRLLNNRDSTSESMLFLEPLEYLSGCMPLLAMSLLITLEVFNNDWQKRIDFMNSSFGQPIPWRLGMCQDFLQRIPVNIILSASTTLTDLTPF